MPPKSKLWEHFLCNKTLYKTDRTHQNAWCKSCVESYIRLCRDADKVAVTEGRLPSIRDDAELQLTALSALDPICGKREKLATHIRICTLVPDNVRRQVVVMLERDGVSPAPSMTSVGSNVEAQPVKWSKTNLVGTSRTTDQLDFSQDLCKLLVSCGISWNAVSNPEMRLFMGKWIPGVAVQDRRILSGRILDGEVKKVEARLIEKVKGKLATGQCDGWENIAKTHVVTSMFTVEHEPYLIRTHNVQGQPKTGDYLLKLILEDIKYMQEVFLVKIIAWCTDDGPDGKKARRLLKAMFAWIIVLVCWAHQINLIVGDFLRLKLPFLESIPLALDVVKWFNNHGAALALLQSEQRFTYQGKVFALILPVITRWTAHYLSVTRLLKVKGAMTSCCVRNEDVLIISAGAEARAKEKAQAILDIVGDANFWADLVKVKRILEPLAIAANITQAPHTRLDHILLTLGNLFRIYSDPDLDDTVRNAILASLEKRWKAADQDVFIVAVFLNPYIRSRCFNRTALTEANLYNIVARVFERIFSQKADLDMLKAFTDYARSQGDTRTWQDDI